MNIRLTIITALAACTAIWAMPGTAHAQTPTPTPTDLFVSDNIGGTFQGGSSILRYTPDGVQSTFAFNLDTPRGLVFDSSGNLFVATNSSIDDLDDMQGAILKITPNGFMSTFVTGFPVNQFLEGLALDSVSGNLFVITSNSLNGFPSIIYKVTPSGTISTFGIQSDCNCSTPGQAFGLAFDSGSPPNLFAADSGTTSIDPTIYKFTADGSMRSVFPPNYTAFTSPQGPTCLAFDSSGDLFVSVGDATTLNNSAVVVFSPDGSTETPIDTGLKVLRGVALDSTSNLFVAEIGQAINPAQGDILKFPLVGASPIPSPAPTPITFASGIGSHGNRGPEFLAFAPPNVTIASNVSTAVTVTFPAGSSAEATTVTVNPSPSPTPDPSKFQLGDPPVAYEITASPAPTTAPIIVAFSPVDPSQHVLHYEYVPSCGCNDWQDVTIYPPNPAPNTVYASVNSLSPFLLAIARTGCHSATSISSNFNGTAISSGNYIWFNGVLKASGLGSTPVMIRFTGQTITSANFTLSVPDATVAFDPAATSATTTFDGSKWVTRVPSRGLAGNAFLSGIGYPVPINLPGGIRNVTWSGTVATDTPGVSVNWKWAAAVYRNFNPNYNALGIKPVDDNKASQYKNSDHAGTPENFKSSVIGGATGGGGTNYTGNYSGAVSVGPCLH